MVRVGRIITAAAVLWLGTGGAGGQTPQPFIRYRVEQVIRLETITAEAQPLPGRLRAQPVSTGVEGRVRFVLEQRWEENPAGRGSPRATNARGTWRFTQVEVEPPHAETPGRASAGVAQVLAVGLAWMQQLDAREFSGAISELPVIPLGEAPPRRLTSWLRWAQTGTFAGVEKDPVTLATASPESAPPFGSGQAPTPEPPAADYKVQWLRSEFRSRSAALCHVQQARWAVPVAAAPASVSAELAAAGVEARSYFSAQSLEWVSQESPALVYAERSAVSETFWSLAKVKKPEVQELVFRIRLGVQVRVERLP
ncbi:MAG: hypothetical protein ACE5HL_02520 [Terriglobia bacterium]